MRAHIPRRRWAHSRHPSQSRYLNLPYVRSLYVYLILADFFVENLLRNRARWSLISSLNFPEQFATPLQSILAQFASARVPFQAPTNYTRQFKPKHLTKRFPSSSPRSHSANVPNRCHDAPSLLGSWVIGGINTAKKRCVHVLRYIDKYGKFWRYDIWYIVIVIPSQGAKWPCLCVNVKKLLHRYASEGLGVECNSGVKSNRIESNQL